MNKKLFKRLVSALITVILLGNTVSIIATETTDDNTLLNLQFDDIISNRGMDNKIVSAGEPRVIDDGKNNKAYYFTEEYGSIGAALSQMPQKVTISLDVKVNSLSADFEVGFSAGEAKSITNIITVKNREIVTKEGKYLSGLGGSGYNNITAVVDNKSLTYDLYINGKQIIRRWKLSAALGTYFNFVKYTGSVSLDNVVIKAGASTEIKGKSVAYNSIADAQIDYDYFTNSDVALVDTENLYDKTWQQSKNYEGGTRAPKTNKITVNRLDLRKDPNRENGYITIEKTTADDAFYDFKSLYQPKYGFFPYYCYTGRIKVDKFGAEIDFAYFRDTITTGSYQNIMPVRIDPSGNVVTAGGKTVKTLSAGEWFEYTIVLDILNHQSNFYLDGKLVETYKYTENFKNPELLRISLNTGGGECTATFDKLKVVGMRNPYNPENPDSHQPLWSSDEPVAEFLSGKTAFYGYSQNVFANGKKHINVDDPYMQNEDVLFVSVNALNLGYNLDLVVNSASKSAKGSSLELYADSSEVSYNGKKVVMSVPCIWHNNTVYVPVEAFAADILGHCVKTDGEGLVITAPEKFDLYTEDTKPEVDIMAHHRFEYDYYTNMTPLRVLNWYMSFERPTVEKLIEDFNNKKESGVSHPRIIASKKEFDTIRENKDKDPQLKEIVDTLLADADRILNNPFEEYDVYDDQRIYDITNDYNNKFQKHGFAYQITGDEKYAKKVWEGLKKILSFPDLNYSHLIDTGEGCTAIAVGYDWTYDWIENNLTNEEKEYIRTNVSRLILDPMKDIMLDLCTTRNEIAGGNDYVTSKGNFNAITNTGTITACLAYAEIEPEKCFELLSLAIRSMEYTMMQFRPDGIWPESPNYWTMTARVLCFSMNSLYASLGDDYGLMEAQGVKKTARWIAQNNSYNYCYSFHDTGRVRTASTFINWFAYYFGDDALQDLCYQQLEYKQRQPELTDALYYNPDLKATKADMPLDAHYYGLDTVYSRSSHSDLKGFYFATHAGLVKTYHSQYDVSTFVLDSMGVRWADDLGSEDYNLQAGNAGVAYRNVAEGHNVMVFEPSETNTVGQLASTDMPDGTTRMNKAYMTKYESKDRGSMVSYNLYEPYNSWVNSYNRGFYVGDDRSSLTIQDNFNVVRDMKSYWFMTTEADVEITDNQNLILTKSGKKMKMEIRCDVPDYEVFTGPAQQLEETASKALKGQNENKGFTRIAIRMPAKANTDYRITVKLTPVDLGPVTTIDDMNIPMENWQIPDGEYIPKPELDVVDIRVNGKLLSEILINGKVTKVEGEPMPVITAKAVNSDNIVEIFNNQDETETIIRVWNPDKSYYSDTVIGYAISKSDSLEDYNILNVKSYDVSSTLEAFNPKEGMFDNDFTTRWTSNNNRKGEYAVFDLGEIVPVDAVAAAFWQGYSRNYQYKIEGSADGENWVTLNEGASNGESEGYEIFGFEKGMYRFIKFNGYGNQANGITNILEIRMLQKK